RLISRFKSGELSGGLVNACDGVNRIQQWIDLLVIHKRAVIIGPLATFSQNYHEPLCACRVSQFAHLERIDTHATHFNGRNACETLNNDRAVPVFECLEFGARLERFTPNFSPELRSRSLGQRGARAAQHKRREKNRSYVHGNSTGEKGFVGAISLT